VFWNIGEYDMSKGLENAKDEEEVIRLMKQRKLDMCAKVQKNLTTMVPYLRGKICQELGLRKAPEIRFYLANDPETVDKAVQEAV